MRAHPPLVPAGHHVLRFPVAPLLFWAAACPPTSGSGAAAARPAAVQEYNAPFGEEDPISPFMDVGKGGGSPAASGSPTPASSDDDDDHPDLEGSNPRRAPKPKVRTPPRTPRRAGTQNPRPLPRPGPYPAADGAPTGGALGGGARAPRAAASAPPEWCPFAVCRHHGG